MRRFYLPPEARGKQIVLEEREAHHALHVLRLRPGDSLQVLNGAGEIYDCTVSAIKKSAIELETVQKRTAAPLPWQLTVFQAIPKGKAFELIVEKLTELGVHRIVPLITERVVGGGSEQNDRRLERWSLTAIDAIKQCGSPWLPRIEPPVALPASLRVEKDFALKMVASLHSGAKHPGEWLRVPSSPALPLKLGIWIGPEGDFTQAELSSLTAAGCKPITLGPFVLRAETAAIYAASIVSYEMQARFGEAATIWPGPGPGIGAPDVPGA